MAAPKLFVSYCWSSEDHEKWVIDLATALRESEVDVILDKWDLKEGNDAVAFMEQMVTDPEIRKVVMICDEKYASKADGRSGGVGTETQIISPEIYAKQDQNKFVAVLSARSAEGKPYLPVYYKSRIYIDLSDAASYAQEFEKLLRWVFDKPLHVKPELGKRPAFLDGGDHVSLGTTASFRRAVTAIKSQKPYAGGAFDEYREIFSSNVERFRLPFKPGGPFDDDAVINSIDAFTPFRNEYLQLIGTIAQYSPTDEFTSRVHRLLESLLPYTARPLQITSWNDADFDNFRFIIYETFLYTLAIFIKHERFKQAAYSLSQQYYFRQRTELGLDPMIGFAVFQQTLASFAQRNQRKGLNKISLRAAYLNERCAGSGLEFEDLMQADLVAYMRADIEATDARLDWVPDTLLYRHESKHPFEIFARAVSRGYFQRMQVLLGISSPTGLEAHWQQYRDGRRQMPRLHLWRSSDPLPLLNYGKWATKP
jgi:hypothetical protein